MTQGRADDLLRRFRELAEQTNRSTEFPANPGVLCAWCGFNAICPSAHIPDELSGGMRLAADRLLPREQTPTVPSDPDRDTPSGPRKKS